MSKITRYKKAVENMRKRHMLEAESLANDIRQQVVLPLCKRKRLDFNSGMGNWVLSYKFRPRGCNGYLRQVRDVKRVEDLLSTLAFGGYPYEIGELMEDYK